MFRKIFLNRKVFGLRKLCPYSDSPPIPTAGEQKLAEALKDKFPSATQVEVADISGGCGAMFEILIEAELFRGKRIVAQHKMVTQALKEEIKDMHGLRITTKVPDVS